MKPLMNGVLLSLLMLTSMPTATLQLPTMPNAVVSLMTIVLMVFKLFDQEKNQLMTDYQIIQNLNGNKSPLVSENGLNDTLTTATDNESLKRLPKELTNFTKHGMQNFFKLQSNRVVQLCG